MALGESWMPAPTSVRAGARSTTSTSNPTLASAMAALSPPMPPPAITTFMEPEIDRRGAGVTLTWPKNAKIRPEADFRCCLSGFYLERAMRFELTTPTLAKPDL